MVFSISEIQAKKGILNQYPENSMFTLSAQRPFYYSTIRFYSL